MAYCPLSGVAFCAKSSELHGRLDPGLFFSALSQYLYLVKFFEWEIGYWPAWKKRIM